MIVDIWIEFQVVKSVGVRAYLKSIAGDIRRLMKGRKENVR